MSNPDQEFLNSIEELILLFKKLQKKAKDEGIIKDDDPMYQNFALLSDNYDMIKGSIPPDMMDDIADPIKKMVGEMVQQLKDDLGVKDEDIVESKTPVEEVVPNLEDERSKIDKLLKSENLSESEINDLLDKRANLK